MVNLFHLLGVPSKCKTLKNIGECSTNSKTTLANENNYTSFQDSVIIVTFTFSEKKSNLLGNVMFKLEVIMLKTLIRT